MIVNPGGPNLAWQALRRPFDLTGTIKSAALVDVERGGWHDELTARIRRGVRETVAAHLGTDHPRAAAIVIAILIGDRAGLPEEIERRLQAAGTYHVMAISGGNMAVLCALVFGLLRVFVRSARLGTVIAMVFVVLYGRVVGDDASVNRAVTAAVVYLGCGLAGLRPRPLHVLSLTALLVVAADPLTVIDVGAWLSFGATLGIVLCAGRIAGSVLPAAAPRRLRRLDRACGLAPARCSAWSWRSPLPRWPPNWCSRRSRPPYLAGSAWPVSSSTSSRFRPWLLVQVGGMTTVLLAGFWASGAQLAAAGSRHAADLLVDSASLVDAAPWLSWRVPPTPVALDAGLYYASLALGLAIGSTRRRAGALRSVRPVSRFWPCSRGWSGLAGTPAGLASLHDDRCRARRVATSCSFRRATRC